MSGPALTEVAQWDVPHAAVAVLDATGAELERATRHPGDDALVYGLASVTKLLVAYAVHVAVEEGALDLGEPAGPPGATVAHLLAHTAGYGFESGSPALSRPGAKRIYSNHGYEVLGAHLGDRTGMAVADYLAEAVLAPLGMASTELAGSPAAGARGTLGDLLAFARELSAPRLLHPTSWQAFVGVAFPGLPGVLPGHGRFDPLDWGLGPERNFARPGHWAGTLVSAHTFGHFGGSGTFLWVDPARRLAAVGLTDRPFGDWARAAWPALNDAIVTAWATPNVGAST
ncbi:MAG: serine hydrolase domain-containing protein [Kineosporiaceae bacterium]